MSGSGSGLFLRFLVVASLLLGWEGSSDAVVSGPSTGTDPEPSVYFDLSGSPSSGVVSPGQSLHLSIRLTAVQPHEDHTVVAIVEGDPFVRRLVPMQFDEQDRA